MSDAIGAEGFTGAGWAVWEPPIEAVRPRGKTPTPEHEDARRRSRERARVVIERGQHAGRIKGLLVTQGIREFEPTRRDCKERFGALRPAEGQPLAPCLRAELRHGCRRLRQVREMVAEVEAEQEAVAEAGDGAAVQPARLRIIGTTGAGVLGNEMFFRDFRNQGLLMVAAIHGAGMQDRDGGVLLMGTLFGLYPFLVKLTPTAAMWGRSIKAWLACACRQVNVGVVKRTDAANSVVRPERWIVERTIVWLNQCRRLAKDWERMNRNALAFLQWVSIRLMVRKPCQVRV